ncbi:MAG TPA: lactate racemase domain-containing protein [Acidimicrobiales bacterium]|nr:lactate racemase domain-containing protein [Acidimicrobiales bacterium]
MGGGAPDRVVVMGAAGSGTATVGRLLAGRRGATFLEGDAFHPASNLEKTAAGRALAEEDRWPWLAALRQALRADARVVLACPALTRRARDALRTAGHVRFVHLGQDPEAGWRDETDVATVDAGREPDVVVEAVDGALRGLSPGTAVAPWRALGGPSTSLSALEVRAEVDEIAEHGVLASGARRVLLVPPDMSRRSSGAGEITGRMFERLCAAGCEVRVLPALGTHRAMTPSQAATLFSGAVPFDRVVAHRWRSGLARVGEVGAAEVAALSSGRMTGPVAVEVDEVLLEDWDVVVSVGQVLPHEVTGMANSTKNVVIGLGGAATINGTHLLGALCGIEQVMGRVQTPVRDVVDAAFDRFLAKRVHVLWILTVVEDRAGGAATRGLFTGWGPTGGSGGAAYRAAAELSSRCNVSLVAEPLERVTCWMDPGEFRSTWLANKAVYRTRMALADGAELTVLAPGVTCFGEDPVVDTLIRRHGYRGTPAVLEAIGTDGELAENLGAAAHLIHGSSEGRFRVVYCTDPASGGLGREEVEAVGYEWRSLPGELARLGLTAAAESGAYRDREGRGFDHLARPALGLWSTVDRLAG